VGTVPCLSNECARTEKDEDMQLETFIRSHSQQINQHIFNGMDQIY